MGDILHMELKFNNTELFKILLIPAMVQIGMYFLNCK